MTSYNMPSSIRNPFRKEQASGVKLCSRFLFRVLFSWGVFVYLVSSSSSWLQAAPSLVLSNEQGQYRLDSHLEVLEDPKGELNIAMVTSPEGGSPFIANEGGVPSFGFTTSVYWIKFTVDNTHTSRTQWILQIDWPLIEYIELYVQKGAQVQQLNRVGMAYPFYTRPLVHRTFLFPLSIDTNSELTYYLRFESEETLQIPLILWSQEKFNEYKALEYAGLGLYYGILLSMVLYNFFIYTATGHKSYLFYVLYISTFGLFTLSQNGLAYQLFWPDYPFFAKWFNLCCIPVLLGWALLFAQHFLLTHRYTPNLHKVMTFGIFIPFGVLAFGIPLGFTGVATLNAVNAFVLTCCLFISGILSWRQGYGPAKYFVLAFISLFIGVIFYILKTLGLITPNILSSNGLQIGSIIEVILLSLGLADRINVLRLEKVKAQAEVLEIHKQAIENLSRLQKSTQEVAASYDMFHTMTHVAEAIIKVLPIKNSAELYISFHETLSDGSGGYAQFQLPIIHSAKGEPLLYLKSVKDLFHTFSEEMPEFAKQLTQQQRTTGSHFNRDLLGIVAWRHDTLLGALELKGIEISSVTADHRESVDMLVQFLSITLENISVTLGLEDKVRRRTKELQNALEAQELVSQNLRKTSQELKQSRESLEQQLIELQASHSKLQDLDSTKDQLLKRLHSLHETDFPILKEHLEYILNNPDTNLGDHTRKAVRTYYDIEESLRPFQSLYLSEQAMQSKRILLTETNRKQQLIAKMALGGTGMELDIASSLEEGRQYLKTQKYDIICTNAELITLARDAIAINPEIKTMFMTSENAPVYLPILEEYPFLSNIVSRNDEDRAFTLKNIFTTVSKLVSNDLFGLEKYLSWGVEVRQHTVNRSATRHEWTEEMENYFTQMGVRRSIVTKCAMIAEELLMNAIYDAPVDAKGTPLYNHLSRTTEIHLKPQEQGKFRYACDGLLVAVSVEDPFGAFDRKTILSYLKSCYEGKAGSLQINKGGAGRGLFQIIETSDLVVFNVKPKVRTEVIAIINIDHDKPKTTQTTSFHYFYV
ncbi:7TM diverse intracellular signaling domain-containing protein [Deltaproteobacteria bacterium TL4]